MTRSPYTLTRALGFAGLLIISLSNLFAATGSAEQKPSAYAMNPVPPDQIPGADIPGTVIVDDGDPAVVTEPATLKSKKIPKPEHYSPTFGETALQLNGYNQIGDGKTSITVSPKLNAGRHAVWVRFARMEHNFPGNADFANVQVTDKLGTWNYACSPRQGGQWVLLGVHELTGTGTVLSLRNEPPGPGRRAMKGFVLFDAAAFVPVGAPAKKPEIYLPPADDGKPGFSTVIRRAAKVAIGPTDTPVTDPIVAQRLRAWDFQARLAWDTLIRTPDRTRLWGDTLFANSDLLTRDAGRIAAMAGAWAGASEIDESGMRGNPQLLADTLAALDTFLTHRWTPTTKWDVNWWDFEIGVPHRILAALCILGPHATPELKAKAFASMERFTDDPWKMYNKGGASTGANRIWMVLNHIRRAALAGDEKGLERCRDGLPGVMAIVDQNSAKLHTRDGWWRDGSFIQHERLPYVGAYGVLLMPDLIECMGYLKGTPWELNAPEVANLATFVDLHLLPVAYEGELFPRTAGRTAGSRGIETCSQWLAIALCEMRPFLSKEQAAEVTARLRRWLDSGTLAPDLNRATFSQFLALYAIATDPDIKPAPPYVASRTHGAVDLALHHRPNWAASVAMSSTRTYSHEALWGDNYRGWNQGNGVLMVYPGDPLRYRENFWALIDPYRLPGITTSSWQLPDHDGGGGSPRKLTKQDFVGGASLDDMASVAAMRVGRDDTTLEARKGWFFLPEAIVCLGSGITSKDNAPCETIVENCRIERADLALSVDGQPVPDGDWKSNLDSAQTLHLAGSKPERALGWWFPQSSKGLIGERVERTGSWRNAAKNGSEAPISRPWLSLILSHGTDPIDATYQYVILPGISADKLKSFAAKPTIEILACTPQVQAVRDKANGIEGYIFFEPGTLGSITADQPCVVVKRESKNGLALAVSDPTHKLKNVSLTLKSQPTGKMVAEDGVKIATDTPLRVDFDLTNAHGASRAIRWIP